MELIDLRFLGQVLGIIVADLVLSGDNAVVIGMAAHRLPERQRRRAIVIGGAGAIGVRVTFTALATFLLAVPLLQALGGAILVWIAFKLLRQEAEVEAGLNVAASMIEAIRIIILADVVMSLDNILAVGALAHGDVGLLLFGLVLSMTILLFFGRLVAELLEKLPWLAYLGSGILAWTAGEMLVRDRLLFTLLGQGLYASVGAVELLHPGELVAIHYGVPAGITLGVLASAYLVARRERLTMQERSLLVAGKEEP